MSEDSLRRKILKEKAKDLLDRLMSALPSSVRSQIEPMVEKRDVQGLIEWAKMSLGVTDDIMGMMFERAMSAVESLLESIPINIIVHTRAYSHSKIARDINRVIKGTVISYSDEVDTYRSNVIVVSTIDYIDIALSSRFIIPADEAVYYGTAEGIPVLTSLSKDVLEGCRVVVPSNFVKNMVSKAGVRVDGVVYHSVGDNEYDPIKSAMIRKRILEKTKCRKLVGWIGANQYRKGIDIAFKVAEYLPRDVATVIISGYGEVSVPEKYDLPRNIVFLDRVFRIKNVFNFYKAFDVFLSTSRSEGFGLPVAEAFSIGKPVVIPRISVFEELFPDDLVYFYEASSTPKYTLYKNYMWMHYQEPDPSDAAEMVMKALNDDKSKEVRRIDYARSKFSLSNYRQLTNTFR